MHSKFFVKSILILLSLRDSGNPCGCAAGFPDVFVCWHRLLSRTYVVKLLGGLHCSFFLAISFVLFQLCKENRTKLIAKKNPLCFVPILGVKSTNRHQSVTDWIKYRGSTANSQQTICSKMKDKQDTVGYLHLDILAVAPCTAPTSYKVRHTTRQKTDIKSNYNMNGSN